MAIGDRIPVGLGRSAQNEGRMDEDRKDHGFLMPEWFNPHGLKMHVEYASLDNSKLLLSSSAAKLEIRVNYFLSNDLYRYFTVERKLMFPNFAWAAGSMSVEHSLVKAMFGLSTVTPYYRDCDPSALEWLRKHNLMASSVRPGVYIRYGQFLNIPGPGSSDDGDANLSIFISDSIKEAVVRLLK